MDRLTSVWPQRRHYLTLPWAPNVSPRGGGQRGRSGGQALVEFALVAPLFLMLLFGVIEYSLINSSVGTFNFAAKDAAREGAIIGKGSVPTQPTPTEVDSYMVNNIILPRVNGVVVAQASEIDIFQATETGACNGGSTCPYKDVWQPKNGVWTSISNKWPSSSRNDALANADYLGVRISYTYTYLTAFFAITSPTINLTATSVQRIEPQQYGQRHMPAVWAWSAPPEWSDALLFVLAPLGVRAVWGPSLPRIRRGGRA